MTNRGDGSTEHVGEDPTNGSPRRQCNSPGGKHAVPSGRPPLLISEHVFDFPCIAAPRPRLLTKGRVYMPKRYQKWKEAVHALWAAEHKRNPGKSLRVEIELDRKGFTVRIYQLPYPPANPPAGDLDNYAKSVLDSLRGLAFEDDNAKHVSQLEVITR